MNTKKIICAVAYVGLVVSTFIVAGGLDIYVDLNSFIIVAVISLLFALGVSNDESFIQKFGNGAVRAGWLGFIIGIVAISTVFGFIFLFNIVYSSSLTFTSSKGSFT